MSHWTFDSIPDQSGRTFIVTGANTGIGFETARALGKKGARVILACRNQQKANAAKERLLADYPTGKWSVEELDLADLESVSEFAKRMASSLKQLSGLILNAGVMVPPHSQTAQGFELQFGVNHLGHFALTGKLLPLLEETPDARVVVVSSTAARAGKLNFDDLQFEKRGYSAWPAYGQSKLANQLFTLELQRRLRAKGSNVLVTAAHPGWTGTDLQRNSGLLAKLNPIFSMQPPQGALPTLRAATDPMAEGADYYGPHGLLQMRGYPVKVDMVKAAKDAASAARLWDVSESLTGVEFGLLSINVGQPGAIWSNLEQSGSG